MLTFADLLSEWDLENWQIVMQKYLITKLLEQLMCTLLKSQKGDGHISPDKKPWN